MSSSATIQIDQPVLRIVPPRGWFDLDLKELWAARELLYFFVWRDVKIRYKRPPSAPHGLYCNRS